MKDSEKLSCEISYFGTEFKFIPEIQETIAIRKQKSFTISEDSQIIMVELLNGKNFVGELPSPEDYQGHFLICDVPDKQVRDILVEKFFEKYKQILIDQANNDPKKLASIDSKIEEWKIAEIRRFDKMHGQLIDGVGV